MKTFLKSFLATGLALGFAVSVIAQVIWSDDFESYADTAALSGPYTQIFPAVPFMLDTGKGFNSNQSIHSGVNANSEARMWINLPGGPVAGTDELPIRVSFDTSIEEVFWHTREYIEIRSYVGGAYDTGGLNDIIALGFNSSGVDATLANYRVLSGPNWGNLSVTRQAIVDAVWVNLSMLIKTNTVEFYVDGVLDQTVSRGGGHLYDSLVIGSGLSTARDVWFDNLTVEVIPEPGTYAAIFGGLALLGAFVWRRRRA